MSGYGKIYEISWWGYVGKAFGWGQVYPFNSDQINFTAKVTNATHTGDVTGSAALTIANDIITHAKLGAEFTTTGAITTALDFGANQVFTKTMGSDTTFTYSNVGIGMVKDFILTGSHTPTFPSGTKTVAGTYDGSVSNLIQIVAIASGDYWMSISKAQ